MLRLDVPSLVAGRRRLGPRVHEPYLSQLVAAAARELPTPAAHVRDGEALVDAASYHGVAGQLLRAVRAGQIALAPAESDALEAVHAERMVRAALLRGELPRVARAVAGAGAPPPLLIKGPAVADRFHVDPEDRPFEDLDLLLPASAVQPAAHALERELGYAHQAAPWPRSLAPHNHSTDLVRRHGVHPLLLELHWRISDDPLASTLDYEHLAPRAEPLTGAPEVLAPAPADQLLLLSVHLIHHGDKRLVWLLDVAAVARAVTEDDWVAAFDRADNAGLGWVLDLALHLTERCLGPVRPRPHGRRPSHPTGWGPLRTATLLGDTAAGFHTGHLATLSGRGRVDYLLTGAGGVIRRALRRSGG